VLTALAVAVKEALVAPAAIVTDAGTVTAALLLASETMVALAAAEVRVTVQLSVAAPVRDVVEQDKALRDGVELPVPAQKVATCITHCPP
jgi:hypothetical protein